MLSVNMLAMSAVVYRLCTVNRKVKTVKSELRRYFRGVFCMSALLGLQWGLGAFSLAFEWDQQGLKFACLFLFVLFTLLQVSTPSFLNPKAEVCVLEIVRGP